MYGKREGVGVCKYPDGRSYDGEWRDDKRHGKGTLTYANGTVFMGTFLEDKMEPGGRFFAKQTRSEHEPVAALGDAKVAANAVSTEVSSLVTHVLQHAGWWAGGYQQHEQKDCVGEDWSLSVMNAVRQHKVTK